VCEVLASYFFGEPESSKRSRSRSMTLLRRRGRRGEQMPKWPATPFEIGDYDNPETVRFRKYATGAHLLLEADPPETGRTPREVVWERGKARLYRYAPGQEKEHPVPVLLVYALILRPYILDLLPGNSLVEHLLGEGFDVYLLDWGAPGRGDEGLSFEHFVLDYLPEAVENVLRSSRAEELTLFGYCQGGTIAVMYAALFPGEHPRNLVLLATPTDFAPGDPGLFGLWTVLTSERYFDPNLLFDPDPVIEAYGNFPADLPGRLLGAAISPLANYAGTYVNLWENVKRDRSAESFLGVSKWVDDGVPFPGEAFRRWIKDFYQQNKLAMGELELRGRRVDLSNIECRVLNIAGEKDFICPLSQAEATMDLVSSEDKEFLVVDAGHVGLMGGQVAKEGLWPWITDWLEPRSR
jgi:polyhydroxyalkanoate synthase